jgi:hypothetical protein
MKRFAIAVAQDAPRRFRNAVATFPHSFRDAGSAPPDAHIVNGDTGWAERVRRLIVEGSRAVLVGDPVAEEVRELRATADSCGALVMLAPAGALDPALALVRQRLAASDGELLECRLRAPSSVSLSGTVVAMLTLARGVDSSLSRLNSVTGERHGLHATGRLESGRDVVFTIDLSDAVRSVLRLRVISSSGLVEADIPLTERGRPAIVRDISARGELHAPSDYLSPSRAALVEFHAAITRSTVVRDLEAFHEDLPFAYQLQGRTVPG